MIKLCSFSPYLSSADYTRSKINNTNIWKANGFNNSSTTIEINYKSNHVKLNINSFVAAYCEIDTISRLHHLLEVIDERISVDSIDRNIIDILHCLCFAKIIK